MSLGQRVGSNPAAMLATLMGKREKLQEELRNIEKQVISLSLVAKKLKKKKKKKKVVLFIEV